MKYNTVVKLFWASVLGIGGFLSSKIPGSFADVRTTDDEINLTVSASCTISSTGSTAQTTTFSTLGLTQSNFGSTTIKTICNDGSGYAIYAVGFNPTTNQKSTTLSSLTSGTTPIATGTATSGDNSNWAMKLSATAGTHAPTINYANNYAAVPSSNTKVVSYSYDTGSEGSTFEANYQVYVAPGQEAGTYTGGVKYTLVHPESAALPNLLSISTMQEMTPDICAESSINDSKQLRDTRDDKLYWVTKLADGNCWMTQNLDLVLSTSTALTSADSDVTSSWTPSTSTYTTGTTTWTSSTTAPVSYDPGDVCWNGDLNTNWNGTLATETVTCTSSNMNYHIGNYYNWTAAVAMNDSSSYTTNGTVVTQSICPKGWTLPLSGSNTGSGSFYNLLNQYGLTSRTTNGSNSIWGAPLSFILGGVWDGSSGGVASGSSYWSSVVYGSDLAHNLFFEVDIVVNPQSDESRRLGYSVRCVAR